MIGARLRGLQRKLRSCGLCDRHKNQIVPQSAYLLEDLNRIGWTFADAFQVENNPVNIRIIDQILDLFFGRGQPDTKVRASAGGASRETSLPASVMIAIECRSAAGKWFSLVGMSLESPRFGPDYTARPGRTCPPLPCHISQMWLQPYCFFRLGEESRPVASRIAKLLVSRAKNHRLLSSVLACSRSLFR